MRFWMRLQRLRVGSERDESQCVCVGVLVERRPKLGEEALSNGG